MRAKAIRTIERIERLVGKLKASYPELARRAAISSRRDGYPRRSSMTTPSSTSARGEIDYADPTPDAALAPNRLDDVQRRYRRAMREITRAERALRVALVQLEEPESDDQGGSQWCSSCARITNAERQPYLTPTHPKIKGRTNVNGRLAVPMALCRWCYDYVEHESKLPPRDLLTEYLVRGKAPRRRT